MYYCNMALPLEPQHYYRSPSNPSALLKIPTLGLGVLKIPTLGLGLGLGLGGLGRGWALS